MLLSQHIVNVIQDTVNNKSEMLYKIFETPAIKKDKDLVSKYVRDYMNEIMEHLLGYYSREDRAIFFNNMAKQYNIKIDEANLTKKPLHIEMVRNNFNSIVSTLKVYE
jgi:lipoate-protein ligase A